MTTREKMTVREGARAVAQYIAEELRLYAVGDKTIVGIYEILCSVADKGYTDGWRDALKQAERDIKALQKAPK